jgi:hypothetical protein
MKHLVVAKLKSRDTPVRSQIAAPLPTSPFEHTRLEVDRQPFSQTQVDWVDGSEEGRKVAAAAGYNLRSPSEWDVYGPTYRLESVAAGKRKAAARHAEEEREKSASLTAMLRRSRRKNP